MAFVGYNKGGAFGLHWKPPEAKRCTMQHVALCELRIEEKSSDYNKRDIWGIRCFIGCEFDSVVDGEIALSIGSL